MGNYCSQCGEKLNDDAKFCGICGTSTAIISVDPRAVPDSQGSHTRDQETSEKKMRYQDDIRGGEKAGSMYNASSDDFLRSENPKKIHSDNDKKYFTVKKFITVGISGAIGIAVKKYAAYDNWGYNPFLVFLITYMAVHIAVSGIWSLFSSSTDSDS